MVNETATVISGSTDIIAIILFGVIAVVLIGILIYLVVMFKRRYTQMRVKFNIIFKDGSSKHVFIKNPQSINRVFKKSYKFDKNALVRKRWGQEIFYKDGVKEPIIFNYLDFDKPLLKSMSASEIDKIIQEKITEKLFGEDALKTTDIILIIVGIIMIVNLFLTFQISDKGVLLTPESIALIKDGFRSVINGG